MTEAEKQQKALDVLKSLNAAVTTTKLYPPGFPQVAHAVEDAYEKMRSFLRKHGELSISLVDDQPLLCGYTVNQKTLGKTHGKDIFQQLRLLHIEHVVLHRGLPRKLFQQILVFFTTSPQLVLKEGGGRAFIADLNIRHLFPEQYAVELQAERDDLFALILQRYQAREAVTDPLIAALSGEIDGETVAGQKKISVLADTLRHPENGVPLIVAAIAASLRGVNRCGDINFPPSFQHILKNIHRYAGEDHRDRLATATAAALVGDLDAFSLHLLVLQPFPQGFGDQLYSLILLRMGPAIDEVVAFMREEEEVVPAITGRDSSQYRHLLKGCERLFASEKGKQYLAREKAKKLIEAGEKGRQAKRVQQGVIAILQGNVNSLRNSEVIKYIPSTIDSLISRGKDRQAATIIENITSELLKGEMVSHDLLSESLSRIGENLVESGKWDWLERLSVPLMAWVKSADRADMIYEKIIRILLQILQYYWESGKEEKGDRLLSLIFAIRTGKLKKSAEVVTVVARLQDSFVDKATLPGLFIRSLEHEDPLADRRLIMQGPIAGRFLINALFTSEKAEHRLNTLELLSKMGNILPPLVLEKLQEPMPWHDKRNLIHLLSETGGREHVADVFTYLHHDDIRVQREAFSCIYKLSGDAEKKKNLLRVLSQTYGFMLEQAVKALMPLADDEVVDEVIKLVNDWHHFASEIRDGLLLQIFDLFGRCKSSKGERALEQFLENEGKSRAKQIPAVVWQGARSALRQIKTYNREVEKKNILSVLGKERTVGTGLQGRNTGTERRTLFAEEQVIEELFLKGDRDKAQKLLVELIWKAAELRRFDEADRLRDWLIERDPMALNDIIRTAEFIEGQKSVGINPDFLGIWSGLYDNLTTEEFNVLYYAMEHSACNEETVLTRQGMSRPVLYFINNGDVKLYYEDKSGEVLVKVAHQGQVIGVDTFFNASVWTVTAAALTKVQISSLQLKKTKNWAVDYPALETKLNDFCREFDDIAVHVAKMQKNRRDHERCPLSGRVSLAILDSDGKNSGIQMTAELSDISSGGLSSVVRISQKNNARILLGRSVDVQISSTTAHGKMETIAGRLVNLKSLYSMNNEYSVHVKFHRLLTREELSGIIEAGKAVTR